MTKREKKALISSRIFKRLEQIFENLTIKLSNSFMTYVRKCLKFLINKDFFVKNNV